MEHIERGRRRERSGSGVEEVSATSKCPRLSRLDTGWRSESAMLRGQRKPGVESSSDEKVSEVLSGTVFRSRYEISTPTYVAQQACGFSAGSS